MSIDPNNPEVLISVRNDIEAATIVVALADRGIDASTTGSFTAGFRGEAPGHVNVIVKHKLEIVVVLGLQNRAIQGTNSGSGDSAFSSSNWHLPGKEPRCTL